MNSTQVIAEFESRALKIAMKTLEAIKAMECVCDIDPKQCAQCEAYIALEKIDSIFNPAITPITRDR